MSAVRGTEPCARLSRRYRFSASHRLHVDHFSDARNRETFGKCNNPFGHGHNYTVQVTFRGPIQAETGMVLNLAEIDRFAQQQLLARFDLANLNQDQAFTQCVPSTENLCVELWRVFACFEEGYEHLTLQQVRVEETNNNAFDYFGEGRPVPSPE